MLHRNAKDEILHLQIRNENSEFSADERIYSVDTLFTHHNALNKKLNNSICIWLRYNTHVLHVLTKGSIQFLKNQLIPKHHIKLKIFKLSAEENNEQ